MDNNKRRDHRVALHLEQDRHPHRVPEPGHPDPIARTSYGLRGDENLGHARALEEGSMTKRDGELFQLWVDWARTAYEKLVGYEPTKHELCVTSPVLAPAFG